MVVVLQNKIFCKLVFKERFLNLKPDMDDVMRVPFSCNMKKCVFKTKCVNKAVLTFHFPVQCSVFSKQNVLTRLQYCNWIWGTNPKMLVSSKWVYRRYQELQGSGTVWCWPLSRIKLCSILLEFTFYPDITVRNGSKCKICSNI